MARAFNTIKQDRAEKTSAYQPSKADREILSQIQRDYQDAYELHHRGFAEFNNRSLIEYINDSQKAFNSYVKPRSSDPDEAWRANTVRPITRNKVISIASHVTTRLMHPAIFAQNSNDQEDKDAALVMKELMEWTEDNYNYDRFFVAAVIAACVNPAVIIREGFADVMRKIKEVKEDGTWSEKEVRDEVFSGFVNEIVPIDEFFILDFYESNIQKQPCIIVRRIIDYSNAKIKYGNIDNFKKFVRPGYRIMFSPEEDAFYDDRVDFLNDRLVEEVTYYNRLEDLEITLVNGVLMTAPDAPMKRADKMYPFAKTVYEYIDEDRFFYGKSLVDKMKDDQRVIDVLYNMILDGSFLSLMPPAVVFGSEEVDSSIITPGTVTTFKNDTRVDMLPVGQNVNTGLNALREVERSLSESSVSQQLQGMSQSGTQTAFEIARLEQNAKQMLGLFGKMISFLVKDFGNLRIKTILQHMTVGEVMDISGGEKRLKFRQILRPEKVVDGQKKTTEIRFDMDVPEEPMDEKAKLGESFKVLEEEGGMDSDREIMKVNPKLFRNLKFSISVSPDIKTERSEAVEKALKLEAYDRAIQNPVIDQEAITRDFLLEAFVPGETDKYVKEQTPAAPAPGPGAEMKGISGSNLVQGLTEQGQMEPGGGAL